MELCFGILCLVSKCCSSESRPVHVCMCVSLACDCDIIQETVAPAALVILLSDALALEAVTSNKMHALEKTLITIKCSRLTLQSIPSHC